MKIRAFDFDDDFDLQKIAIPLSSVFPEQRIER